MGAFSTVSCEEIFGTDKEKRDSTSWTRSVQLRVDAADKDNLIQDLLGTPRMHPSNALLVADSCNATPYKSKYTASGQQIVYTDYAVTVNYSIPGGDAGSPTPQDPVDLVSESIEPYTKVITQDYADFKWASDDVPLKEGEEIGKVLHGIKLIRTIFYVTTMPVNLLTLPGSVHNRSYTSSLLGQTFASGTLLFIPPVLNRTINTAGAGAWNLKLSWDYNENEWNKVWRPQTQVWDSVLRKDNDAPVVTYPEKDHAPFLP